MNENHKHMQLIIRRDNEQYWNKKGHQWWREKFHKHETNCTVELQSLLMVHYSLEHVSYRDVRCIYFNMLRESNRNYFMSISTELSSAVDILEVFILPSWRLFHCIGGLSKIARLDIINDIDIPLPPHIMTDHYGRTTEHLLFLRLAVCCGNVFCIHPGIGFTRCCHTQSHAQALKTHTNSGWTQYTAAAEWSTRTWKTLLMHTHWPFQGLVFWFTKEAHWLCSKT